MPDTPPPPPPLMQQQLHQEEQLHQEHQEHQEEQLHQEQQQPLKLSSRFPDREQVIVTASRLIVHLR